MPRSYPKYTANRTRAMIAKLRDDMEAEDVRHAARRRTLDRRLTYLRNRCLHEWVPLTHHPECSRCTICGIRRIADETR